MQCSNCTNEACEAHVVIKCTNNLCGKRFHIDCVASLKGKTYNQWEQTDMDSFLCHCCKYCTVIQRNDTLWEDLGLRNYNIKFQRLGLEYKNVNLDYSKRLLRDKVNSIKFNYTMLNDYGEYRKHLKLLN